VTPLSVVIVSCARDLAVNRLSIPAVLQQIRASSYAVVVPGRDLPSFKAVLPGEVDAIAEETLLPAWSVGRIADSLPSAVAPRGGWYLQQFLKIEAIRQLAGGEEALIWDGDTIPLRPMNFKDTDDRIGFYVGRGERHEPYFDTLRRLLGLERVMPESFIAQSMYVRVNWIHSLLEAIMQRTGKAWVDSILACISGIDPSEFSEYETLGTFVVSSFPREVFLIDRPWYRWGMAHFGGIDRVSELGLQKLSRIYDYVALERWDRGRVAWLRSRTQRLIDSTQLRPRCPDWAERSRP
jgi:Family of unknown function (DUF6492)